jgi:flavin reductase (DIM6/NTAB) family NADH-FMN oxidoreductase RutF
MILVTCRGRATVLGRESEKHDIIVIENHAWASQNPKLYAVFIPNREAFGLGLIRHSRVFCVNVVEGHKASIAFCARTSGEHQDKFKEADFIHAECETIDCPRIEQAASWTECEVFEERLIGDHVMFVGSVRASR